MRSRGKRAFMALIFLMFVAPLCATSFSSDSESFLSGNSNKSELRQLKEQVTILQDKFEALSGNMNKLKTDQTAHILTALEKMVKARDDMQSIVQKNGNKMKRDSSARGYMYAIMGLFLMYQFYRSWRLK